jgi:hypothetical protein
MGNYGVFRNVDNNQGVFRFYQDYSTSISRITSFTLRI